MNPADLTARSTTVRTEEGPARLSVSHVTKLFQRQHGDLVRAIDDVSFDVREGELLVLLGPSGCGKSTLLRSIAGLESPTEGRISISGEDVYEASKRINRSPDNRDVNMMFQSYALWPHMTLEDNVAYPLRTAGVGRSAARSRARDYLELVGLEGLGQQHPGLISGGQQQRVALARTLISEPSIVLFDEPLSNVDARIKVKLRSLLVRLHQQLGFAAVYVTHDQVEAMGLGTRIAVMRHGRVDQLASPVTVYESPSNRATAEFVGEATFWEGTVIGRDGGAVLVDVAEGQLRVPLDAWPSGIDPEVGDHPTLMVRPEKCTLTRVEASESDPYAKPWHGVVASRTFAGAHTEYQVQMRDQLLSVWAFGAPDPALRESTQVTITIPEGALRVVADD